MPNVFLTLAYRPDEFRAFFAYHDALMERDSGLTKAEREMIVVATSSANQCHYCVIAHGAILRIRAKNPQIADQIAVNYRKADITPRQRAMLDFAMKVSAEAHRISEADFAEVAGHGFSDDDIWDIAAISAFFALSNRMANVTAMRPNDEFYMMGRLPGRWRRPWCPLPSGSPLAGTPNRPTRVRTSPANRPRPCLSPEPALLDRLFEIGFHALARHLAAQEIRPQEFAERRGILGITADAPQFAGEAAERIVLEVGDRFRNVLEVPAFALGVVGIDPPLDCPSTPQKASRSTMVRSAMMVTRMSFTPSSCSARAR